MIDDTGRAAGGTFGEYARGSRDTGTERSVSDVVKDVIGNVQDIVRSEVRLARAELREEISRSSAAAKLMGIGAGLGLLSIAFVLVAVTLLLALVMPDWLAAFIVGAVLGIAGLVLLTKGRSQFTVPKPNRTIESVRENVQWMKDQTK